MRGMDITIGTVVVLILALAVLVMLFLFVPPLMSMANSTTNGSGSLINMWPF